MTRLLPYYIRTNKHVLVYGPHATGKTHLAYYFFRLAERLGKHPVLVATEPGTILFLEHVRENRYVRALTIDEQLRVITEMAVEGRFIVIDSINWHYRENPTPRTAKMLSYMASLLHEIGGFSVAQVTEEGRPSGANYLLPWAHVIGETSRENGRFRLLIIKPIRRIFLFRITTDGGIVWL